MKNELSEVAIREGKPFRLFFHIGAGKTGTSSIQSTLNAQQGKLKKQEIWYLGRMLENSPIKKFDWQRNGGARDFIDLDEQRGTSEVLNILRSAIPKIEAAGCRQGIWSNEAFFRQCQSRMLHIMRELVGDGVEVHIVAYVRRHDAWLRSAYVQWGLKHKTYFGHVHSFNDWLKLRSNKANFYQCIRPWIDAFGESVIVRNLDAAGDAVGDFMDVVGINQDGLERIRTNETPAGEELFFRALYNDQFNGKVLARQFDKLVRTKSLNFDLSVDEFLNQQMPSEDMLRDVAMERSDDRKALDELLVSSGQPPIDTSPLKFKPVDVDPDKVLTTVCQLVVAQETKISELEEKLNELTKQQTENSEKSITLQGASGKRISNNNEACDQPVFAISTGRSGSTLVQRVLNCHQDLVMWGEHFGFLNGLADTYNKMANPEQKLFPKQIDENHGPALLVPYLQDPAAQLEWVNPWSFVEFKEQLKCFIEGYFSTRLRPGQRWGFKEIQYNSLPTLRMLKQLYPKGRFIFIRRNPLDVTRSKIFAFVKEDKWSQFSEIDKKKRVRQMLDVANQHYKVYDTFMEKNQEVGLIVDYEELVAQPEVVTKRMLSHLNLDPDRYDWDLGGKVMGNIITKTKRDDDVIDLIRTVADDMEIYEY